MVASGLSPIAASHWLGDFGHVVLSSLLAKCGWEGFPAQGAAIWVTRESARKTLGWVWDKWL